jgi:glutaredoxin 2
MKKVSFDLEYILNDDVETPTQMIGKKMVPILQKEDGSYMAESMDIIHYIDANYGGAPIVKGATNTKVAEWLEQSRVYVNKLAMPRWVKAPLEEFRTEGARKYFTQKKEASIGSFDEHMQHSDALKEQANEHLEALEMLIVSPEAINGELSEDDFHVYAKLRSLSIVTGLHYMPKVQAYRTRMETMSQVELHEAIAK